MVGHRLEGDRIGSRDPNALFERAGLGGDEGNFELDPEIVSLIQNTKVDVKGSTLSISTVVDPALIEVILDD